MNIAEWKLVVFKLSLLTRQSFLLRTELHKLLNVFETDHEKNTSRIIHDRQLRNCVTTALTLFAVGFPARL